MWALLSLTGKAPEKVWEQGMANVEGKGSGENKRELQGEMRAHCILNIRASEAIDHDLEQSHRGGSP